MLSVAHRLNLSKVKISGKRHHGKFVSLIHKPSNQSYRAAVIVSKKIANKAVDRNLLRRRLLNSIKDISQNQAINGDFIVLPKAGASQVKYAQLRQDIHQLISQLPATDQT